MKRFLMLYLLLLAVAVPLAHADFYQWTDSDGVVHFTDKRSKIPEKYRKRAKKLDLPDEPSAVSVGGSSAQAPPKTSTPAAKPLMPGGYDEQWWRNRYATLRDQVKQVQGGLSEKQAKLVELRRKRAIYQRAKDREAVNAMTQEIAADEARLADLQKQLESLETDATVAGVPAEWRR